MRARTILLVSIVLNVALGVALITWLITAPKNIPRVVRPINSAALSTNNIRILKTNVLVLRPRTFTWQEVESPDYAVYVENLRALGMPDATVRDIIVADVDQIFAARRRAAVTQQDMEWWRSTASVTAQTNALARAQALDAERAALLARLLGPDWNKGRLEFETIPLALTGPVLGSMSDGLKASVQSIAEKSTQRVRDYHGQKQSSGESVSTVELARLREETRQQLAAVLSPMQLEEFLLRYSENALRLREELNGFESTPDEFRALFRATDSIDRDIQLRYSGDSTDEQRQRAALEQQRLAAVLKAVGPERFTAYQMARDPAYQESVATAREVGGGTEVAQSLYEIKRATADELARIRSDASLTAEQKQQMMRETELEQMRARALALGEQPAEPATTAPEQPQIRTHAVHAGEHVGLIALRYGVGVRAILDANPGVDINALPPGTVIAIPPALPAPTTPPPPLPGGLPYPPGLRR